MKDTTWKPLRLINKIHFYCETVDEIEFIIHWAETVRYLLHIYMVISISHHMITS